MNAIRFVLFGFLLVLVGATLLAQCRPSAWKSERSTTLPVPPERVHAFLDDLERWPAMLRGENAAEAAPTFGARRQGGGAEMTIAGPQGPTTITLGASDAARGIEYRVGPPGGMNAIDGRLTWTADGAGTRVTITEGGDVGWGPIERFMRGVIEEGHAEELGRRLDRLAKALEAGAEAATAPAAK